ncbi:MAG: hypothetical protein ACON4N_01820 [Myxococcota bacterium]
MTAPFGTWADRLATAGDEASRRAMLAEIGAWRAGRLTDMNAQRHASWALSSLYAQLGDHAQAANEGQQLLALCQMPPKVSKAEMRFAHDHVRRLARNNKKAEAAASGRGHERRDWSEAAQLVRTGQFAEARKAAPSRKGPRAAIFRVLCDLGEALYSEEREAALAGLFEQLISRYENDGSNEASGPQAAEIPGALAAILEAPVPSRRDDLMDLLERFLEENPARVDEVAAAALEHHVAVQGTKANAPWLFTIVGRALCSSEGAATRAAVARLSERGAYAVSAYGESGFERGVTVLRSAVALGYDIKSFRRGVLRKGEPPERRLWTFRVTRDFTERLLVVAPFGVTPYAGKTAKRLAARCVDLADRVVVWSEGQEAFTAAASAAGATTVEVDTIEQVLEALEQVEPHGRKRKAPAEGAASSEPAASSDAPSGPDVLAQLGELFVREEAPTLEDYEAPMSGLRRAFKAFDAIRDVVEAGELADLDTRLTTFLRALHLSAPAGIMLAEGTTLALRFAARGDENAMRTAFEEEGFQTRFGGLGWQGAVSITAAMTGAGWRLDRVYRGTSRRERRARPALDTFGDALGGFWRLVYRGEGDRSCTLWWLTDLTPEGTAAVPLVLLDIQPDVVLKAADAAVELGEVTSMDWPDAGAEALVTALQG